MRKQINRALKILRPLARKAGYEKKLHLECSLLVSCGKLEDALSDLENKALEIAKAS
jgi:hypothetical protein